jgi:aspartate/methionine/tyrosine aminotransferase
MKPHNFVFAQPTCAARWRNFQTSIFSSMTQMANEHNAVNLAQGFPDFEGPVEVLNFAQNFLQNQNHQYAPSAGDLKLREVVSRNLYERFNVKFDPNTEITITAGATEGIYCVVNALVNAGESVVVFEPCYDSYSQAVAQAGGVLKPVEMFAPGVAGNSSWQIDWETFNQYKHSQPKLIILNSPHNPTGKMFSEEELSRIADFVFETGCFVLCDEVYEHLIFENKEHISLLQFEKIQHQIVRISSAAKTFGFTGFKVGWVCAHSQITQAIRLVHQATVFCTPRFLQSAIAESLASRVWYNEYLEAFKREYQEKRDFLVSGLIQAGFLVPKTFASYFVMANFETIHPELNSVQAANWFIQNKKVAAIPPSAFYSQSPKRLPWLRFAFCKKTETLSEAVTRLNSPALTN